MLQEFRDLHPKPQEGFFLNQDVVMLQTEELKQKNFIGQNISEFATFQTFTNKDSISNRLLKDINDTLSRSPNQVQEVIFSVNFLGNLVFSFLKIPELMEFDVKIVQQHQKQLDWQQLDFKTITTFRIQITRSLLILLENALIQRIFQKISFKQYFQAFQTQWSQEAIKFQATQDLKGVHLSQKCFQKKYGQGYYKYKKSCERFNNKFCTMLKRFIKKIRSSQKFIRTNQVNEIYREIIQKLSEDNQLNLQLILLFMIYSHFQKLTYKQEYEKLASVKKFTLNFLLNVKFIKKINDSREAQKNGCYWYFKYCMIQKKQYFDDLRQDILTHLPPIQKQKVLPSS